MQTGHIYKKVNLKGKGSWYLRYWDTIIQPDGSAKRKLVTTMSPYEIFTAVSSVLWRRSPSSRMLVAVAHVGLFRTTFHLS